MNDMKPWLCKNKKHRLGMITWNGDGIPQLMLYRHAVDLDTEHPAQVDVIGPLEGRMPVRCDVCDEVSMWEVSLDVLLAMIGRLDGRKAEKFIERLGRGKAKVAFE